MQTMVSTDPTYTFTVTGDRALTAVFEQVSTYTVTAAISPAGSGTVTGAGQYNAGGIVTLTAIAADGYKFKGFQIDGYTITTDDEYVFTATKDVDLVAVFETKVSRLPDGYTEVEYIQTVSGQNHYIDTGIYQSYVYTIEVDFEPLEANTSKYPNYILYSESNALVSNQMHYYAYEASWSKTGILAVMARAIGGSPGLVTISTDVQPRRRTIRMTQNGRTISIDDGTPVDCSNGLPAQYSSANMMILGTGTSVWALPAKLYSCKIWNSSGQTRDFVPCTNANGIAGLYDLIGKKFYQSVNNSGSVIAGPAV